MENPALLTKYFRFPLTRNGTDYQYKWWSDLTGTHWSEPPDFTTIKEYDYKLILFNEKFKYREILFSKISYDFVNVYGGELLHLKSFCVNGKLMENEPLNNGLFFDE